MVKSTVHSEDQVFPEMELEAAAMEPSKKLKESSDKSKLDIHFIDHQPTYT